MDPRHLRDTRAVQSHATTAVIDAIGYFVVLLHQLFGAGADPWASLAGRAPEPAVTLEYNDAQWSITGSSE